MAHPEIILSFHKVKYFFNKPKIKDAVLFRRLGEEKYNNLRCGHMDLDWSVVPPGFCLVGDHHVFDCLVKKWDETQGKWIGVRPWFSAWLDCGSLRFIGWFIRDIEPNTVAVEDSFLNALLRMNGIPPAFVKTDNGKDYLSYGFGTDVVCRDEDGREHPHSVMRSLGCRHITALPYNARAKTIERMFGIVARTFSRSWASRRGNSPGNRPSTSVFGEKHPELLPSLQEFTEAFAWWLDTYYHERRGRGKILRGRSPNEAWAEWKPARSPLTEEEMARAFLRPAAKTGADPMYTVGRGGRLTVDRVTYQSPALWELVGKKVFVKVCRTPGREMAVACRANGTEIAVAKPIELIPAIGATPEQISNGQRAVRRQLVNARTVSRELMAGGTAQVGPVTDRLALVGQSDSQAKKAIEQLRLEESTGMHANLYEAASPAQKLSAEEQAALERAMFGADEF